MITYRAFTGQWFTVEFDDLQQVCTMNEVTPRTKKSKRHYTLLHSGGRFVCKGKTCKLDCMHAQIAAQLMRQDQGILQKPLMGLLAIVGERVERLRFTAVVIQRTLEDKIEPLLVVVREEYRERVIQEYMRVFDNHRDIIDSRKLLCSRCITHLSCVRSARQGMACLAYFMYLDHQDSLELLEMIPLTEDALTVLDFPELLLLAYLHCLNFDMLTDLSSDGLRKTLLRLSQKPMVALTA